MAAADRRRDRLLLLLLLLLLFFFLAVGISIAALVLVIEDTSEVRQAATSLVIENCLLAGIPAASCSVTGDTVVCNDTLVYYECINEAWVYEGSLKGPAGSGLIGLGIYGVVCSASGPPASPVCNAAFAGNMALCIAGSNAATYGNVYDCLAYGAWSAPVINVVGPSGATGSTGATGGGGGPGSMGATGAAGGVGGTGAGGAGATGGRGPPPVVAPSHDGYVLAWNLGTSSWEGEGNPIYYGTNTDAIIGANSVVLGANASSGSTSDVECVMLGFGTSSETGYTLNDVVLIGAVSSVNSNSPSTVVIGNHGHTYHGANSIAIGANTIFGGATNVQIGAGSQGAFNGLTTVIGGLVAGLGAKSVAVGALVNGGSTWTTSIGLASSAQGMNTVCIGGAASATAGSVSVGYASSSDVSVALGAQSHGGAGSYTAIGPSATATVAGLALGASASAQTYAGTVAIGTSATPSSAANALALTLNSASVEASTLGVTLNGNPYVLRNMYASLYATTAGSGPTTLTASSSRYQVFTTAQTVLLPAVNTLQLGFAFDIINYAASGNLLVQSSGGNLKLSMANATYARFVCSSISGTTAASWLAQSGPAVS